MLNYVDEEQNEFYFTSSTSEFLPGLMVFKETDYTVSYSSFRGYWYLKKLIALSHTLVSGVIGI